MQLDTDLLELIFKAFILSLSHTFTLWHSLVLRSGAAVM